MDIDCNIPFGCSTMISILSSLLIFQYEFSTCIQLVVVSVKVSQVKMQVLKQTNGQSTNGFFLFYIFLL